jgi:hypothetical protein
MSLSLLKCCVTVIASSDTRCAIVDNSCDEADRSKLAELSKKLGSEHEQT